MKDKQQQPLFKEREDGILEYCGPTDKTAAVDAWQALDGQIDVDIWTQASIAAAIVPSYGKQDRQEFAESVGKKANWIGKMARTYRFFTTIGTRVPDSNLRFKTYVVAMLYDDPQRAASLAAEKGWSSARLLEWIREQKPAHDRDSGGPKVRSELIEFNEKVEETLEGLMGECPDKAYGKRVIGGWLQDLRGENKRLYLWEFRAICVQAIEKEAARTIPQLVKMTGIRKGDVEAVVSQLIDEELYEWIQQRGEPDGAKGGHTLILHRIGERDGSACNISNTVARYVN